jgi:hypothetical protein
MGFNSGLKGLINKIKALALFIVTTRLTMTLQGQRMQL